MRVDGVDAAAMPRADLARRIAYVPQGQMLHWPLTVERLVGLGRLPHLAPMSRIGDADTAAIERAMARADVLDLRDRIATELSGGERARVLFARALAVEAPALIADEPLASLDPGHQIDVMDMLRAEAAGGALVIAVLHDLTLAARYCDRLLLIDAGRIVADGSARRGADRGAAARRLWHRRAGRDRRRMADDHRARTRFGLGSAVQRAGSTRTVRLARLPSAERLRSSTAPLTATGPT